MNFLIQLDLSWLRLIWWPPKEVFLGWSGLPGRGRALGVGEVKFRGQIYPDAEVIQYRLDIKRVFRRPMPLGVADGRVLHDGQTIYEVKDLKVGLINTLMVNKS